MRPEPSVVGGQTLDQDPAIPTRKNDEFQAMDHEIERYEMKFVRPKTSNWSCRLTRLMSEFDAEGKKAAAVTESICHLWARQLDFIGSD
jgi:hypothetical protein